MDVESSDSDYPTKSKRELREEQDSKVYTIATDSLIKTLMTEYKRRKQANVMPKFVKISKKTKKSGQTQPRDPTEKVDRQIEEQRKTSYMKVCSLHRFDRLFIVLLHFRLSNFMC